MVVYYSGVRTHFNLISTLLLAFRLILTFPLLQMDFEEPPCSYICVHIHAYFLRLNLRSGIMESKSRHTFFFKKGFLQRTVNCC